MKGAGERHPLDTKKKESLRLRRDPVKRRAPGLPIFL
jgi:hypothetical protein